MKAIVETSKDQNTLEWRAALLEKYRKELREWSRMRLGSPLNTQTSEALRSLERIEKLERMLSNWAAQRYRLEHQFPEERG